MFNNHQIDRLYRHIMTAAGERNLDLFLRHWVTDDGWTSFELFSHNDVKVGSVLARPAGEFKGHSMMEIEGDVFCTLNGRILFHYLYTL